MLVSDEDVNNYNKIKTDLDKLRLLVEQSELWIYKKKESSKESGEEGTTTSTITGTTTTTATDESSPKRKEESITKTSATSSATERKTSFSQREQSPSSSHDQADEQFVLQELDNGPELEQSAILKYKALYKILRNMIKLCVYETRLPNGTVKKKPRRNDQRLLRNMGVHNIVLDLTKISYEKAEDNRMKIIMKTAHEFLQNFCFSNSNNQVNIYI